MKTLTFDPTLLIKENLTLTLIIVICLFSFLKINI